MCTVETGAGCGVFILSSGRSRGGVQVAGVCKCAYLWSGTSATASAGVCGSSDGCYFLYTWNLLMSSMEQSTRFCDEVQWETELCSIQEDCWSLLQNKTLSPVVMSTPWLLLGAPDLFAASQMYLDISALLMLVVWNHSGFSMEFHKRPEKLVTLLLSFSQWS